MEAKDLFLIFKAPTGIPKFSMMSFKEIENKVAVELTDQEWDVH